MADTYRNTIGTLHQKIKQLMALWQQIDEQHLINAAVFQNLLHNFKQINAKAEPSLFELNKLKKDISQLKQYLQQFEEFTLTCQLFFKKDRNIVNNADNDIQNKHQQAYQNWHWEAAEQQAQQIYQAFSEGKYILTGLQPSLARLHYHIAKYEEEVIAQQSKAQKPQNTDYNISQQQRANKVKSNPKIPLKTQVSKIAFPPPIPKKQYKKIQKAFYRLQKQYLFPDNKGLKSIFRKKGTKVNLANELPLLQEALRQNNAQLLQNALQKISEKIQPTVLQIDRKTRYKVQDIHGTSHPNTELKLLVNKQQKYLTEADKQGKFIFKDVVLDIGKNVLSYRNKAYDFLNTETPSIIVKVKDAHLFSGLIDPATQERLLVNEIDSIRRCQQCMNFMYDYSIEENLGRCVHGLCSNSDFYTHKDKYFWVKK